ncbi:MAG: NAD(P)/FAD-dependent oxidoreductase, partial [Lachnospiraceae bacterium]|nr:NAD(P)/FAD-dependent oxidoreductase [Lachnospiraceae bacterium]
MNYDLIIIGGGPGGYTAAIRAAQLGMKTVVIEKKKLGGTCLNEGCIPAKALIHAASLYREMKSCDRFGLSAENIVYDFEKVNAYKEESMHLFRSEVREQFQELGITLIHGTGKILSFKKVKVDRADGEEQILEGKYILIASGAQPNKPDIPGIDLPEVLTSVQLMTEWKTPVDELIIMGGGVIGVEIATLFNAIGTKVSIVEASHQLLSPMDQEISDNLIEIFKSRGIAVYFDSKVQKIEKTEGKLSCQVQKENGEMFQLSADNVLVAVGRKAYTEGLFE